MLIYSGLFQILENPVYVGIILGPNIIFLLHF